VSSDERGQKLKRPILPFRLSHNEQNIEIDALVDTGATVNVLPYDIGEALRLQWPEQSRPVVLTGNLARYEARGVLLIGYIGQFTPVELIFAWTRAQGIPLLLGQVNFFAEFDVCFFNARGVFEVQPKVF
jgi:hypothetical protein